LFIEDDDAIRLALSLALEDEGYEVREAEDGKSGLAAFAEREPDLVLLDLRLPDMSGFEVCRNMRATSIVPIIIVTAQADTYDLVAGLEAGADDYVTKPVVPKELAARIRAALRRGQRSRSVRSRCDGESPNPAAQTRPVTREVLIRRRIESLSGLYVGTAVLSRDDWHGPHFRSGSPSVFDRMG
jgi:DNA-binding response OmpR family regulator